MKSLPLMLIFLTLIIINNITLCAAGSGSIRKSVDERDDNGDINEESKDESLDIPVEPNESQPAATPTETNTTCTRRSNSQMHEIKTAVHKQFPFVASIMSSQNEHLCTGTVVSNGLILTSAHCTQLPVSYVLLNATKAKKDETTVALHVIKTERFPTFTGAEGDKDVGLIYTEKHNNTIAAKMKLSDFTSTRSVIDMEVIGFGLNTEVGQMKELQYIGAENRLMLLHPTDVKEELTAYIDCIDTKVPTCFRDKGGPSIFSNELVGIVTKGDDQCFKELTSSYSVNKKVADILPAYIFKAWLEERIQKNEEQDLVALVSFPNNPVPSRRRIEPAIAPLSRASNLKATEIVFSLTFLLSFTAFF